MPTIEATDFDFRRLQRFAVPLVDTPTTVLTKILDLLEGGTFRTDATSEVLGDLNVFGPDSLPPLVHTKFMSGLFGEKAPDKQSWDAMVRLALESIFEKYQDVNRLRQLSGANVVAGEKTDEGYKFLDALGFSFQGVSAEDAVDIVIRSARALRVPVQMDFIWRNKPEAFRPGEGGRIES